MMCLFCHPKPVDSKPRFICFYYLNVPSPTDIYTLSLHDALPISHRGWCCPMTASTETANQATDHTYLSKPRSEEHTSELQSRGHLVCRLLLEKKKEHV